MNYSVVRFILFKVIMLVGILMSLPLIVALIYREELSAGVFLGLMIGCIVVGIIGSHFKPKKIVLYAKEGFVITALSWIIISLIGAVPFVLTGTIPSYVDAVFETISGFTTTGASILPAAGGLEYSVQFWRTFSHWIGGMGVLVFMIAVIPLADGSGMHIMRAESPGPSVGKIVPKIKDTARTLYLIYFLITMLEVICLMITGLDIYSALTITFSTVGTGGFAITNAGIGGYSLMTQTVIIVFMALCGVN
nr:TrkH family potassium uptake protein [Butyrivibrio sp.]